MEIILEVTNLTSSYSLSDVRWPRAKYADAWKVHLYAYLCLRASKHSFGGGIVRCKGRRRNGHPRQA